MGSAIREAGAAASALGAYLTTVLPEARRELKRLGPLPPEKPKNAEAVAVFATLVPCSQRPAVVRAIVALQAAIDLRDELEESGDGDSRASAARLEGFEANWRRDVAGLPAYAALAPLLERAVERCAEGQRRTHAAALGDVEGLRRWAESLDSEADYRWWEVAAGASSSVAAHALIAAAATPGTTAETGAAIDAAYHPTIGALTVFLDDLEDREEDRAAGEHNYLAYYESAESAADRLALIASRAEARVDSLPHAGRHRAILAGVAAFYLSSPAAATAYARPIRERLLQGLGPGARLLARFTRIRRLAARKRSEQVGGSPGP